MDPSTTATSPAATAADGASAGDKPKDNRNDNSNPQQGTGGVRLLSPQVTPSPPLPRQHSVSPAPVPYSRPSLKIPPTQRDDRKLFVGGLPANVTSEEFRSFFEGFGPVMDSIVLVDKMTNRSRGFGFVTFERSDTAKHLLAMGDCPDGVGRLEMQGKTIEVKAAQPKESSARRFHNNHHGGNHHHHRYDAMQHQHGNAPAPNVADFQHVVPQPPMPYGHNNQQQPFYPAAPGAVAFAGYVAPMYYHLPPPQDAVPPEGAVMAPAFHHQPPPIMMEGGGMPAAYAFVPAAPVYGGVMPHSPPQGPLPEQQAYPGDNANGTNPQY